MSNNGPDICPRCGGNMLAQKWKGEGSCLQCGNWHYGNNGHGRRSPALLVRTARYLVVEEPLSDQELPSLVSDSPIFRAFTHIFDDCAAKNGGCGHCKAKRRCQALWNQGCLIEGQGHFNLRCYRIFSKKALDLLKTP